MKDMHTLSKLKELAEMELVEFNKGPNTWVPEAEYDEGFNPKAVLALLECVEALVSIACISKSKQNETAYWLGTNHEMCASVLTTDTVIAREAITALEKAGVVL